MGSPSCLVPREREELGEEREENETLKKSRPRAQDKEERHVPPQDPTAWPCVRDSACGGGGKVIDAPDRQAAGGELGLGNGRKSTRGEREGYFGWVH